MTIPKIKSLRFLTPALLSLLALSAAAQTATPPVGPAAEAQASYKRQQINILKAAEKMPAADYQFKGTPEIRTYARVINHITEAQFSSCLAVNGVKMDKALVPSDTADKEAIIVGLRASFAACDKAYGALSDANVAELIQVNPTVKRSRIGIAWGNISHDNEQYAILSIQLRLKGLVPPTAEK